MPRDRIEALQEGNNSSELTPMPWDRIEALQEGDNSPEARLLDLCRRLGALRARERSLSLGEAEAIPAGPAAAFLRSWDQSERFLVVLNPGNQTLSEVALQDPRLPPQATLRLSTHQPVPQDPQVTWGPSSSCPTRGCCSASPTPHSARPAPQRLWGRSRAPPHPHPTLTPPTEQGDPPTPSAPTCGLTPPPTTTPQKQGTPHHHPQVGGSNTRCLSPILGGSSHSRSPLLPKSTAWVPFLDPPLVWGCPPPPIALVLWGRSLLPHTLHFGGGPLAVLGSPKWEGFPLVSGEVLGSPLPKILIK
ncbi:uncharacterized protein LOC141972369 [Athene noctua]|uniref:uncharacterized protein LOC141972369 n=1 Tax=Athene noctua TaxID=126797 RepID=UPI003EBA5B3B